MLLLMDFVGPSPLVGGTATVSSVVTLEIDEAGPMCSDVGRFVLTTRGDVVVFVEDLDRGGESSSKLGS